MNQYSGILIPIVAMLIPIVAIIGGVYSQVQARRLKADQRMAMIARGVPLAEIESFLKTQPDSDERGIKDPMRSLGNARRAATVLISVGLGLIAFFLVFGLVMLTKIDRSDGWTLVGCSGLGLIPLAIGVGFLFDYTMQKREMSRFGLEIDPKPLR